MTCRHRNTAKNINSVAKLRTVRIIESMRLKLNISCILALLKCRQEGWISLLIYFSNIRFASIANTDFSLFNFGRTKNWITGFF